MCYCRVVLATQIWIYSHPLSTLTNSSITGKIMDQELTFNSAGTQKCFHEGGQYSRELSREEAALVLTAYANLFGVGNMQALGVLPLAQCDVVLGSGDRCY